MTLGQSPQAAAPPAPSPGATLLRQAIVERDGRVHGYSLRSPAPGTPVTLSDAQLSRLTGGRLAFVVPDRRVLDGTEPIPDRYVLEIPAAEWKRPDAATRLAALRARGGRIALKGFTGAPGEDAVLPSADYVYVPAATEALGRLIAQAHDAATIVIADGVRNRRTAQGCRHEGAELLRGPVLLLGPDTARRDPSPGELQCLEMLRILEAPEVDTRALATVAGQDPAVTLRVLRLANSSAIGLRTKVDSIRQALVLLGPRRTSELVLASLLGARAESGDVLWAVLARALACRELTRDEAGYTVGMLSALSDHLDVAPEEMVARAGVSDVVRAALAGLPGELGAALAAVRGYEHDDPAALGVTGWDPEHVARVHITAVATAHDAVARVLGGPASA